MTRRKAATVDDRYMARVYIQQARCQRHRGAWHATLLRWAGKARASAMREHLARNTLNPKAPAA